MRACLFLSVIFIFACQSVVYSQEKNVLAEQEGALHRIGKDMFVSESEPDRLKNNFAFIKSLVQSLKTRHSFDYPFSRLDMISIVKDPNDKFRIFSWNIPLHDGSYLYFGSIQFRTKSGELKLVPLMDKTFDIEDPEKALLSSKTWYGAQYYDIIPLGSSYLLLGWKGHSQEYSQKVIEVLTVEGDEITFGQAVFPENPDQHRRIFSFTQQASMFLKYFPSEKTIYFDHLVPAHPELVGQYKYYGPDLSQDAYQIQKDKLKFIENIELRMTHE